MRNYEKELLALAWETCRRQGYAMTLLPDGSVSVSSEGYPSAVYGSCWAVLKLEGVEVPTRPTDAHIGYLRMKLRDAVTEEAAGETPAAIHAVESFLRGFDRLTVLALLDGER